MSESQPAAQQAAKPPIVERGIIVNGVRIASAMTDVPPQLLAHVPLVLLPEAGFLWRDYTSLLEGFTSQRRVFALDWPGFGASEPFKDAESAYAIPGLSALLEKWLTGLGIARCVIVGNGLSAAVAIHFAAGHPRRVAGLALLAPAGFTAAGRARALIASLAGHSWIARRFGTGLSSLALGPDTPESRAILERQRTLRNTPAHAGHVAALSTFWRQFDQPETNVAEMARSVRAPAVVLRGALDPIITEADAHQAAQSLGERGALEIVLPNAGHLPFLQQPARVIQAITGVIETAEVEAARLS